MSSLRAIQTGVYTPPAQWPAGNPTPAGNKFFPSAAGSRLSHVFTVEGGVWAVQAYGLQAGDEIIVEMVAGCREGDYFEQMTLGCCDLSLTQSRNTLLLPIEGRYRLNMLVGDPEDVYVIAYPSPISAEIAAKMLCCETASGPVSSTTVANSDGSLVVTGGPNYTVNTQPVGMAAALAASAPAVLTLATALGITFAPTAAPATSDDPATPTTMYGVRTALLGEPSAWISIAGYRVPAYA
jgi:hypothetical protein